MPEFTEIFHEDPDIEKQRKRARELLEVEQDCMDFSQINQKYKKLALNHHPDKGGDEKKFQEMTKAFQLLKKELA